MKHLHNPPRRPKLDIARDDAAYEQAHQDIADANQAIIRAAWDAAQVTASASDCPDCGSGDVMVFDIEGKRSYVCRSCGTRWT